MLEIINPRRTPLSLLHLYFWDISEHATSFSHAVVSYVIFGGPYNTNITRAQSAESWTQIVQLGINISTFSALYEQVVLEWTPKYQTSNTPNIECPNIELSEHHILAQNQTSNMSNITKNQTVCEHQTVCSKTSLVTNQQDQTLNTSEHHILAQNRTSNMSNITKNRTVREHRTVHSKNTRHHLIILTKALPT